MTEGPKHPESRGKPDVVRLAPELKAEVLALIDAVLERRASDIERARFEKLVVENPAVAEFYLQTVHLCCSLPLHLSRSAEDLNAGRGDFGPATVAPMDDSMAMDESMVLPAIRESDLSDFEEPALTLIPIPSAPVVRPPRRRWWWGSAAAMLLLAGSAVWMLRSGRTEVAGPVKPVANPTDVPPVVVTATAGIEFEPSGAAMPATSPGTALTGGQVVQLGGGGAIELTFASGAVVVVQGPARLDVVDQNAMRLESGAISVHVPPAAHGFRVTSPGLFVVDRGTDFGLRTPAGTAVSEVQIFQGVVDVTGANAAGQPNTLTVRATTGQAFRHDAATTAAPGPVAFTPEKFTRKIEEARVPVPMHNTGDGLTPGVPDPNWQIVSFPGDPTWVPTLANVLITNEGVHYTADTDTGKWIGVHTMVDPEPAGEFVFRTNVDLSGFDPKTLTVHAEVAVDNRVSDIRVNGVSTGVSTQTSDNEFNSTYVDLPMGCWKNGVNQIDVVVANELDQTGGINPMGLRILWTARAVPVVHR